MCSPLKALLSALFGALLQISALAACFSFILPAAPSEEKGGEVESARNKTTGGCKNHNRRLLSAFSDGAFLCGFPRPRADLHRPRARKGRQTPSLKFKGKFPV
jgi:hypothetical protein